MRLNMDIIFDHLPDSYQVKRYGIGDKSLWLEQPVLYDEVTEWKEDRLYIARTDLLPRETIPQGIALIGVGRHLPEKWVDSNNQILLICGRESVFSVFNQIYDIFNRFEKWECDMLQALARDADFDMNQVLQLGQKLLGNPITIMDSSLRIILLSNDDRQDSRFSGESLPAEAYLLLQGVCQTERMITVPYLSSLSHEGRKVYCCNLYPFGCFSGCAWVTEEYHPFCESDFALADCFFSYLQQSFVRYLKNSVHTDKRELHALEHMLEQGFLSAEDEELLSLAPGFQWVCFRLRERKHKKYMPPDYMCAMLNSLLTDTAYAVLKGNSIYGIWKYSAEDKPLQISDSHPFCSLIANMEYVAVFSNSFTDLRKITDSLLQVNFLVNECVDDLSEQTLYYFRDYIMEFWLYECSSKLSIKDFCSDDLSALIAYDKKKGTEYLKTLDTYLEHEMNVSATAKALYINRSSLIKRLNKMKAILNCDLKDSNIRLYFRFFFQLWKSGYGEE